MVADHAEDGSPLWQGYLPVALVALVGVAISGLAFDQVQQWERQEVGQAFREAARDRVLVIQREIEHTLGVVQDIGSFFDASRRVRRRQFREYVGPALRRQRSIAALEWVPWVPEGELEAFEREARRGFSRFRVSERGPDGTVEKAASRPVHLPILYVQPYRHNREALGHDLASEPAVLKAFRETRDAGRMTVSSAFPIPWQGRVRTAFVARLPVYRKDPESEADTDEEGTDTPAAGEGQLPPELRRERIRGFAAGVFLVSDLLEEALDNLSPAGIDVRFYDLSGGAVKVRIYTHSSRLRKRPIAQGAVPMTGAQWAFNGTLSIADRTWSAECSPVPGRFTPGFWKAWTVLLAGLAFTALLTVYLSTLVGRAAAVRRLVAERTAQLLRANEALNIEVDVRTRAEEALQRLNETLEQRVARRTAEAERRADELEQFAYVASHDLKAPLRAIANLASWLEEDLEDRLTGETREQLVLLRDRVRRMHALIEGLLEYSRVGRVKGAEEDVDTAKLLAETLDSLAPPAEMQVHVDPGMPTLRTDRMQLGQVFANLIGNAIKHRSSAGGQIWVQARERGPLVEFTVADDGSGIAPEYRNKVFRMFQTLEPRDEGGDTGIGLALVKKIVQEHGGSISLGAREGGGASFRFTWRGVPVTDA